MKKKNVLMIALSLCLAAVIAVGATLAYFTDTTKSKTNVVTTGNVKIQLNDTSLDLHDGSVIGEPNGDSGITYDDIMPGDKVSKQVSVQKLAGTQDCYVAIRVDVTDSEIVGAKPLADSAKKDIMDDIKASAEDNGWYCLSLTDISAIFYREEALTDANVAAEDAVLLFNTVSIPTTWDNDMAEATFDIDVKAAAVQEANLAAPALVESTTEGGETAWELNDALQELHDLLTGTTADAGDTEEPATQG